MVTDLFLFAAGLSIFYAILVLARSWFGPFNPHVEISRSPSHLPIYAAYSLLRIGIAYILSLAFTLVYGYVAAYNPRADFTPNLDTFAHDNSAVRNVYTQYAGTTLSEPAIWSGTALLHAHYMQPFSRVNGLEKLARVDGYQMMVSYDTVLSQILSPDDELIKLDTDKPLWNRIEVCSTIQQTESALETRIDKNRPADIIRTLHHLQVRKLRNVLRDRILERQLALIDQLHRDHAGDGLGHREQTKDRLVRDRCLGDHVLYAESFVIDRLAVLLDQHHRAGDFARRHFVAEELADLCQPVLIEMCTGGNLERAFRTS